MRYTEIYWDKPTISWDDHGILRDKHNRCWDNHHIFQYFNLLRYTQLNWVYWSISRYMCGTTGIIFHEKLSRAMLWDSCSTAEISQYGTSYTEMSRWSAFQGKWGKTRKNTVMRVQLELTHSIAQFTEFPLESWPPGELSITEYNLVILGITAVVA